VNLNGVCGKCGRSFSLTEVKTGKCPYQDCQSEDIYAEDDQGAEGKYIGKRFNSNGDRLKHHERH
jgi:hypothetical protein